MKKIAIVFVIVGLSVGVAYAESLQDILKRHIEKEASQLEQGKLKVSGTFNLWFQ